MNCKPGDLAVVVKSLTKPENVGRIVRCIRSTLRIGAVSRVDAWCWIVEPNITAHGAIADTCLRPIRDPGEDATDEMLQRVGKPESAAIEWALGVRDVTPL